MPISAVTARRVSACVDAADELEVFACELRGKIRACGGGSSVVIQDWFATEQNQTAARINKGIYAATAALDKLIEKYRKEEDEARRAPCPVCVNPQRKHCPRCGACVSDKAAREWSDELEHNLEWTCSGDFHQAQLMGRQRALAVG